MATYAEMLLADFELRDDLQTVSLVNSVTGETTTGIKARDRSLNFRETMLSGELGLESTDIAWMLGCGGLGDVVPHRGDKIISGDTSWTILSLTQEGFGTVPVYYVALCREQI
jgi:hypothetical protein